MRKRGWKAAAIALSGALILGLAVPASGARNAGGGEKESSQAEKAEKNSSSESAENGTDQSGNTEREADSPDKAETVQAKADASGNITKITVEDTLKNPGGSEKIEDFSALSDIKNTQGDEEFTQKSNGDILWDNNGEDIQYKGISDGELPVSVQVSYYLDGEEMAPEKIAGKSGKVRIRFDYENHTSESVSIEGTEEKVQVPFAVFSAMLLDADVFSNVEVTNGKIISIGEQKAVVGYAFPGLAESLGLKDYEPTQDMDVPDYVEITADVEKFELAFTATVVSNGVFQEIDTEELKDVDDLVDSMSDFTEASSKLTDGASEISKSMETLQSYMGQYIKGVGAVNDGAKALADGLSALNQQKSALSDGASALTQGIETLNTVLGQSDIAGQIQSLAVRMFNFSEAVQSQVSAAGGELAAVDLTDAENLANAKAREQAENAVDAALAEIEGLTEEQKAQIREQVISGIDVSGMTFEAQAHITAAKEHLGQIPSLDGAEMSADGSGNRSSLFQSEGGDMNSSSQSESSDMSSLLDSMQQLQDGSRQLTDGIAAFNQGVEQLYAGAVALSEGTAGLVTTGDSLNMGVAALADGIKALENGISAFDEEGVQELEKLAGDDLKTVIWRVKALKQIDSEYDNFSGIREGQTGSVRFVIETDEIK